MNKNYYVYYNSTLDKYINEDLELVDKDNVYRFEEEYKDQAIKDIECLKNPEEWKLVRI